jgi:PhnB protein
MAKRSLADRLDRIVAEMFAADHGAGMGVRDHRLAGLARLADDLRDLPRPSFRERLKSDLERRAGMSAIRAGFRTITPYVMVPQAEEMIDFVKSVFGAQEVFRGTGSAGGVHAEVRIGDSMMMIGGGGAFRGTPTPTALQYYVPNADEVYARAIAAGATASLDLMEQWGDRFGAVRDPFGNDWIISTHLGPRYVPEGLGDVTIYLHPVGAAKLIGFLKEAFGAAEFVRHDSPEGSGAARQSAHRRLDDRDGRGARPVAGDAHCDLFVCPGCGRGVSQSDGGRRGLAFRTRGSALRRPPGGGAGFLRKPVVHRDTHAGRVMRGGS